MLGKAKFIMGTAPPQLNGKGYRIFNPLQRRGEGFPVTDPPGRSCTEGCDPAHRPKPCPSIPNVLPLPEPGTSAGLWGVSPSVSLMHAEKPSQRRGDKGAVSYQLGEDSQKRICRKAAEQAAKVRKCEIWFTSLAPSLRMKLKYFLHYKSKRFSGLISPFPDETFHNPADI